MSLMVHASLEQNLRRHVHTLATAIGERNLFRRHALQAASDYIRSEWQSQGYVVTDQTYSVAGAVCANLEIVWPGRTQTDECVLIGAHYDSVQGSPGADDNASGIAGLLEISRHLTACSAGKTVRCVAFVNEEPPFFFWKNMGSLVYAKAARRHGDRIALMISLEMLGCYDQRPGSQDYPPLLKYFYPDRGDFIAFVSNLRSWRGLREAIAAFRAHSDFPARALAAPWFLPGVGWSDHLSFWRQGYRALMVTDTAFFRYPYYHTALDTADRLDYGAMSRVVAGLCGAVTQLAG